MDHIFLTKLIYEQGENYPERLVIHEDVSLRNCLWMQNFQKELLLKMNKEVIPAHCPPSPDVEILRNFFLYEGIDNLKYFLNNIILVFCSFIYS